jgi:hypothetical protein
MCSRLVISSNSFRKFSARGYAVTSDLAASEIKNGFIRRNPRADSMNIRVCHVKQSQDMFSPIIDLSQSRGGQKARLRILESRNYRRSFSIRSASQI